MFPHSDAYAVSSAQGMRGDNADPGVDLGPRDRAASAEHRIQRRPGPARRAPASNADATIVCGFLGCDLQPFNSLIAALPRLLHLRADAEDGWIARFTAQAVAEWHARRSGGEAMLARMSERMFVDAVRRCAAGLPADSGGRALGLLHEQPARRG